MRIEKKFNLQHLNTFGVKCISENYVELNSIHELQVFFKDYNEVFTNKNCLLLGSGSNILFVDEIYDGTVMRLLFNDIEVVKQSEKNVHISAGAGVLWHDLVIFCVKNGYAGIENMSLIPGTIGAAPIQNIGAYGVELSDLVVEISVFDKHNGTFYVLGKDKCNFGYRESIFKNQLKNQVIICGITICLNKYPNININYPDLQSALATIPIPTIHDVSEAVIKIRKSKLPSINLYGNAGSFFKNAFVNIDKFERLRQRYPSIPKFIANDGNVKVPAAWLIEQAGWKGAKLGNVGVYEAHYLIIVNLGQASGREIYDFACKVRDSVKNTFDIQLEFEVNIIEKTLHNCS